MSRQPDLAAALSRETRALAGQVRVTLPHLRAAPALADAAADWGDALQAVGETVARDLQPIGALRRLSRAHGLLLAELRLIWGRPR